MSESKFENNLSEDKKTNLVISSIRFGKSKWRETTLWSYCCTCGYRCQGVVDELRKQSVYEALSHRNCPQCGVAINLEQVTEF